MKANSIPLFMVACVVLAQISTPVQAQGQERAPIEVMPLNGGTSGTAPTPLTPRQPSSTAPSLSSPAPTSMIRPNAPPERDLLRGGSAALQTDSQGRVILTPEYCAQQVEAQPAPGVAYQAGTDVYGRPVAPADIPGSNQAGLPVGTNILVDPTRRSPVPGVRQETYVGTVTVDPAGRALMNGRPLDGPQPGTLAAACAELMRKP
jgi:hypothetical protein